MKKYIFLRKPLWFIFNLVLSSWIVLQIEKFHPSNFDNHELPTSPHENLKEAQAPEPGTDKRKFRKSALQKLFLDYQRGLVDSSRLDQEVNRLLKTHEDILSSD